MEFFNTFYIEKRAFDMIKTVENFNKSHHPFSTTQQTTNHAFKKTPESIEEKTKRVFETLSKEGIQLNLEIKKIIYNHFLRQKNNENKKETYLKTFKKWGLKPFLNTKKEIEISSSDYLIKQKIPSKIMMIPFRAFLVLFHELEWDRNFFSSQDWMVCSTPKPHIENHLKDPLAKSIVDLALQVIDKETRCFFMEEI